MSSPNTFDLDTFNLACMVSLVDDGSREKLDTAFKTVSDHLPVNMAISEEGEVIPRGEVFGELIQSVSEDILEDNEQALANDLPVAIKPKLRLPPDIKA